MKPGILIIVMLLLTQFTFAQNVKQSSLAKVRKCHIPADSSITLKVTLEEAKSWADSVPLEVICDDLKSYKLYNFDFTIFTMNPMQSKEYGTGNGGIPILAKRAIAALQPRDAVILKNATYLDDSGNEQPLPVISFSIKE